MVSRSEDFVATLATYSDKEPLGDDWPFKKCTSSRILSHTFTVSQILLCAASEINQIHTKEGNSKEERSFKSQNF